MATKTFSQIRIGAKFRYDGEMFVKTETGECFDPPRKEGGLAWSILFGEKYKEWAFIGDEVVQPVGA